MTIDQYAREHALAVREQLDTLVVPDVEIVLRRARRRRAVLIASGIVLLVAALVVPIAVVVWARSPQKQVSVGTKPSVGTTTVGPWRMILKGSVGLDNASLQAITSDGTTMLLLGRQGRTTKIWGSDDGLRWSATRLPSVSVPVTTLALHGDTALAIGASNGNARVWRSDDRGRSWRVVARGEIFGKPVPRSRPGPIVANLMWSHGWWIASGGAASGYEGIWISRDGERWRLVLDSRSSGSIDGVVETDDGVLMAYGVGATSAASVEIGWFTQDPTSWRVGVPVSTPDRFFLSSVAPGAGVAIGHKSDTAGEATPLLRSTDGGHTWTEDESFRSLFADAWAWAATTTNDLEVLVGSATADVASAGVPAAWLSATRGSYGTIPDDFKVPRLPTTQVPQLPPPGALTLVGSAGRRIVMLGSDARLDRYYTFDVNLRRSPSEPQPRDIEVFAEGQCFDYDGNNVSCTDVHTREDFARFSAPEIASPSDTGQVRRAMIVCQDLFERFTGVPYDDQDQYSVEIGIGGNETSSDVQCSITSPRGAIEPTTGSAQGALR